MKRKKEITELIQIENFIDFNKEIEKDDKTFQKLMFIYKVAIKELQTKIEILQEEAQILYNYNLIEQVKTRIKEPESIIEKMQKKQCKLNYEQMIENINDIAGVRVICPIKKDVFVIRDLINKIPGIHILKEKDYVTNPKKSGYSSYHLIVEVPIVLSKEIIYVKVEIQIRTIAMDFWASLEHKMKYKADIEINNKKSKEWIKVAKIIERLDNRMMILNN